MKLKSIYDIIYKDCAHLQMKVVHRMIREKSMDTTMELFKNTHILLNVVFPTRQRIIQTENVTYWSDNADKVYDNIHDQLIIFRNIPYENRLKTTRQTIEDTG